MTRGLSKLSFARHFILLFGLFMPLASAEAGLVMSSGPIDLRVSGDIEHSNQNRGAVFDRAMIEAPGMEKLVTEAP